MSPPPSNLPHPLSPQALLITFLLALAVYIATFRASSLTHAVMGLINVSGQYTDLFTVFPLPKKLLQSLLPKNIYEALLPVPGSYGLGPDEHLVMLHLGRQHTGPPFYRFHAQEAKFEVPFVAPPFSTSPDHGRAVPSVFKHSLWTDHTIMATSARYAMGLRTEKAVFDPPTAPSDAMNQRALADSAVQAKYEVKGRVSWEGTKVEGEFVKEQYAGEQGTLRTSEMWWFGEYAAGTLCKFPFTHNRPPAPYKSTIRLHLPSLARGPVPLPAAPKLGQGLRDNFRVEGEWLVLEGVTTWWTDAGWVLDGPHKVAGVEQQELGKAEKK